MNILKTILLFAFCLLLTVPSVVDGLLRIPNLFAHYYHHNHEHETISFIDFLNNHYLDEHQADDPQEHNNLPFHDHHNIVDLQHFVAINFQHNSYTFQKNLYQEKKLKKLTFIQEFFSSNISISIWRPPQVIV